MSYEYLSHLARIGSRDIHPGRENASASLIGALKLAPGLRVLEIGCGTGTSLVRVARSPGVEVTGVDMLPEMLTQATRRVGRSGLGDRVRFVQGLMSALPFADESFDRVYCESVVAFQSNEVLRATLAEVRRVLRSGGLFIASEGIWKPGVDAAVARCLNADCIRDFGLPQATEEAWDCDAWRRELETAGFRVRSADLLPFADGRNGELPLRVPASGGVFARSCAWLHPGNLARRLRYGRLLRRYRPRSRDVEGRLFVVERH